MRYHICTYPTLICVFIHRVIPDVKYNFISFLWPYPVEEADRRELSETVAGHVLEDSEWRHQGRTPLPDRRQTKHLNGVHHQRQDVTQQKYLI